VSVSRDLARLRLLVCGHPFHDVILDLAAGLERRDWRVDLMAAPFVRSAEGGVLTRVVGRVLPVRSGLARALRRADAELADPVAASRWFGEIESTLARREHDAVIAYLDLIPAGLARMIARRHPAAVLVSLVALAQELRFRRTFPLLRLSARARARGPLHADLLRPIAAEDVPLVVCPSRAWLDDVLTAGLASERGCVIPFGVELPAEATPRLVRPDEPARLLWAGRLAPEKGLHLFLRALPLVAARRAVRLTIIAAPGGDRYEQEIARIIDTTPGLAELIEMRGPVSRPDLRAELGRHDLLLFHSVFREPVAQILLMAAALRLPVVAPTSPDRASLIREGETAWSYADSSPVTIAAAVLRALDDPETRASRALAFEREVRRDHNLAHTIEAYDRLLRARVASVRHPERLSA
jgi:glycosyltransferase involved in cell wall biosynthesis